MTSSAITLPRRRGRRLLAASAALGLALGLSACTIGEVDDDTAATDTSATQQTSATESAEPTASTKAEADSQAAPATELDQLILTAADAPDLGLQPVSPEEIAGGMDMIGGLTEGLKVEPPHCAEFSQDTLMAQSEPGTMAIQAGQKDDIAYAVAVTTVIDGLPDRAAAIEDCPVMTVSFPLGEGGRDLVTETANTVLDVEAPAGVENFVAVQQDSSMDMMGQNVTSGNLIVTGTVRGIGVSVTATIPAGEVSPEAQTTAMDTFVKQAEKVRAAA